MQQKKEWDIFWRLRNEETILFYKESCLDFALYADLYFRMDRNFLPVRLTNFSFNLRFYFVIYNCSAVRRTDLHTEKRKNFSAKTLLLTERLEF